MTKISRYGKDKWYELAWKAKLRLSAQNDLAFLKAAYPLGTPLEQIQKDWEMFNRELNEFESLRMSLNKHKSFLKHNFESLVLGGWLPLLYALVRIQKPRILIETGCATGTTTSIFLYAISKNKRGHLYSIDIRFPDDFICQNNLQTGFLVPEELNLNWSFKNQDIKFALPSLANELGKIDFFYHDSAHSYLHHIWEYLTAWQYLRIGGILCSDDLRHNTAFFDFARQIPETLNITSRGQNFGYIIREHDYDLSQARM